MHLGIATLISLLTALLAFEISELDPKTLLTFGAFYVILASMYFMFRLRLNISDPSTRQLLQFSYFLLGFVLMITGFLGSLSGGVKMSIVFLLMVFLPGLACIRAGLNFNKSGD